MAGKAKFDQEAAFKSIIGVGNESIEKVGKVMAGKGRPKVDGETKKRVSLFVYPSTYSDLQKIAFIDRQSVSDIVTKLIAQYVVDNQDKLKEYDKINPKE